MTADSTTAARRSRTATASGQATDATTDVRNTDTTTARSETDATTDVLVVGAGTTGLTLAAGLLGRGLRVRVIDRAERANPHSKAVILWPRALEAFQTLGLGEEMVRRAVGLVATSYYTGDRLIGRLPMPPLAGTRFPIAVSLPQSDTEALLRAEVERRGGTIEFGRQLTSTSEHADGVTAQLADGSRIRAGWVVGCDGAHSTVRDLMGAGFEGATYPQTFMLVDGQFDTEYAHDESCYVMHPEGVIVILGLPGGHYRAFVSVPPDASEGDAEEAVRRVLAAHSPRRMTLAAATGSGTFQVHRKMADRMGAGRLLIAGDAAHIHSPAGGVGMNTGVQDAHTLAWRLAGVVHGTLPADELDAWQRERLAVARGVIADTDRQTKMWMLTGWQRRLRDLLIGVALRTTLLERVLPRRLAQLDLVVPADGPRLGKLRPGGRLTDVELADGTRLHDHFDDGRHLLLGFGSGGTEVLRRWRREGRPDPASVHALAVTDRPGDLPAGVTAVPDPRSRLRRVVGAPRDGVCLVRPDAVIAGAAKPGDESALARIRARLDLLASSSTVTTREGVLT
jgi:2-polyprenyl-6-methoxyphenol hydroxylase-like FAD-dependent oxidoreductase